MVRHPKLGAVLGFVSVAALFTSCSHKSRNEDRKDPPPPQSSDQFTYRFSENGCDTGEQRASTIEALCRLLSDERANKGCARAARTRQMRIDCADLLADGTVKLPSSDADVESSTTTTTTTMPTARPSTNPGNDTPPSPVKLTGGSWVSRWSPTFTDTLSFQENGTGTKSVTYDGGFSETELTFNYSVDQSKTPHRAELIVTNISPGNSSQSVGDRFLCVFGREAGQISTLDEVLNCSMSGSSYPTSLLWNPAAGHYGYYTR